MLLLDYEVVLVPEGVGENVYSWKGRLSLYIYYIYFIVYLERCNPLTSVMEFGGYGGGEASPVWSEAELI